MSSRAKDQMDVEEKKQEEMLEALETELAQVEGQLDVTLLQASLAAAPSGGRAVFDSIGTALGSIRMHLQQIGGGGRRISLPETERLSLRLQTAERAHTARIPLGMLQREISRRRDSTNDLFNQKEEQDEQQQQSTRASVSLASRRLAEAAEGHQADMDLHGASLHILSTENEGEEQVEIQLTEPNDVDMLQSTEPNDVDMTQPNDVDMISPVMEGADEDRSEEFTMHDDVDDEKAGDDKGELPIVLTRSSLASMDSRRRSVLFHKSESSKSLTVTSDTVVYSWGSGVNSLHDDSKDRTVEQARVDPNSRVGRSDLVSASAGHYHSACSTASGEVLVVGKNTDGIVDPDRKFGELIARPVSLESLPMSRIVQVSCGLNHTAALRSNGAVLTWGSNEFGQLGHRQPFRGDHKPATGAFRPKIMLLGAGRLATSVACGDGFTLVLTSRMGVLACGVQVVAGYSKEQGESHLAAPIPALEDLPIVSITAGRRHAVAVTANGSAFAWGENSHGCLGREYPKSTAVPVPFKLESGLSSSSGSVLPEPLSRWTYREGQSGHASIANDIAVIDAACGDEHTVLLARSGRLLVCGNNSKGQLGVDPKLKGVVHHAEPVEHPNASEGRSFVCVEAGEAHTLVLDDSGDVWQLGGAVWPGVTRVLEKKFIKWIAAGGNQCIAVAIAPGRRLPSRDFSDRFGGDDGIELVRSVEDLLSDVASEMETEVDGDKTKPLGIAARELVTRTEELLKCPAVLNSLFLDPTELEDLFEKLLSADSKPLKQAMSSAIEKGIQKGLDSVQSDDARLMYPEQVRFLLLYIQCPLFANCDVEDDVVFDRRGDLILSLCETIVGLSYEGYKALLSWATSIYPRETFARLLLRPLLCQLEKGLSVSVGARRRPVPAIVTVLRWLYNASERLGGIALPEDFYCQAIEKTTDPRWLMDDLVRYRKANEHERAAHFFLCANPFLFSPTTKRTLLHIESEMQMLETAAQRLTYNVEERTFEFDPFWVLDIDREHILPHTLQKVAKAEARDLRKKLRVVFKGEDGVDAGGVTREFFQLLSEQLFDVSSGMWSTKYGNITWFNSDCTWNDEGFFLVGILVGLAVYNSTLLDVHFPQAVFRKLLGHSLGLEDLVDDEIKKSFQQLLDYEAGDVEDIFCLTFEVTWMDLGEEKKRELKSGGSNIAVTADNKEEYVMLYVKWLLVDSIYPQYEAFERGFMRVMEYSSLSLLRPEDLELLVVGSPELDFEALEANTEYEGGYDKDSAVVKHFWHFVKNASPDTQVMLLKFTTGSCKAPIGGLGELTFKIQKAGPDSMQLPSSHTCFNTLLLPDYGDNREKLEERLGRAIVECEGFGLQ